jgi:hypothetical protein
VRGADAEKRCLFGGLGFEILFSLSFIFAHNFSARLTLTIDEEKNK